MKKEKVITILILTCFMFTLLPMTAFAADTDKSVYIEMQIGSHNVSVNDKTFRNDVPPKLVGGRTMLPIRVVAEALGAELDWNKALQQVTITKDGTSIQIFIGKNYALVNGMKESLDAAAFIDNSRTYLPVRFVSENLGANVKWNANSQSIVITTGAISSDEDGENKKTISINDFLGKWYVGTTGICFINFIDETNCEMNTFENDKFLKFKWDLQNGNTLSIDGEELYFKLSNGILELRLDESVVTLYKNQAVAESVGLSEDKKEIQILNSTSFLGGLARVEYFVHDNVYYGFIDKRGNLKFQFPSNYGTPYSMADGYTLVNFGVSKKIVLLNKDGEIVREFSGVLQTHNLYAGKNDYNDEHQENVDGLKNDYFIIEEDISTIDKYETKRTMYTINGTVTANEVFQESNIDYFDKWDFADKMNKYGDLLEWGSGIYGGYYIFDNGNVAIGLTGKNKKNYFAIYSATGQLLVEPIEYRSFVWQDEKQDTLLVNAIDGGVNLYNNTGKHIGFCSEDGYNVENYSEGIVIAKYSNWNYCFLDKQGNVLFDGFNVKYLKDLTQEFKVYQ